MPREYPRTRKTQTVIVILTDPNAKDHKRGRCSGEHGPGRRDRDCRRSQADCRQLSVCHQGSQGYIDVPRNAFNLSLLSALPQKARIGDIGGGLGLFAPGCAALGFDVSCVDDFRDAWHKTVTEDIFDRVHRREFGITIVNRDVVSDGADFEPESFGCIYCL